MPGWGQLSRLSSIALIHKQGVRCDLYQPQQALQYFLGVIFDQFAVAKNLGAQFRAEFLV